MRHHSGFVTHDLRQLRRTLRESLPPLMPLAEKVARVHGGHDPRLVAVNEGLGELARRLVEHLDREDRAEPGGQTSPAEAVALKAEHVEVRMLAHALRAAAGGYVPPDWACASYRQLFGRLERLHAELFFQIELESEALGS